MFKPTLVSGPTLDDFTAQPSTSKSALCSAGPAHQKIDNNEATAVTATATAF